MANPIPYLLIHKKLVAARITMDQCLTNADSWAFFCADAAGALTDRDRIAALGSKLYADTGWKPPQKVVRTAVAQAQ